MAVRVRVQNFQSIEDVAIEIDGLTVITGTNNSGKTAVMRAIRGVFTNAPAGPLVRHGCAHLTVSLTFDDGATIVWGKGWEKPNRKGKTINRYTINGKQIATVGRGVPPEVEALGVREINAASDRVWPQIAAQMSGDLFLVDRPGSAVAEALSDVERVGKLTSALKASEKDRRSTVSELKVRRKDVTSHQEAWDKYIGLDSVGGVVRGLGDTRSALVESERGITEIRALADRYETSRRTLAELDGFDPDVIPDPAKSRKLSQAVAMVAGFRDQHSAAKNGVDFLDGFDPDVIPDSEAVVELLREITTVTRCRERLTSTQALVNSFVGLPDMDLPTTDHIVQARAALSVVLDFHHRCISANTDINAAATEAKHNAQELSEAEAEVIRLLGDRGVCPTCNTIHEGSHP